MEAATASGIDAEFSPGIESAGMDVTGAGVVVVASVSVVVDPGTVVASGASPEESHADPTRATRRTTQAINDLRCCGMAGRLPADTGNRWSGVA
jgi:hypothetical protein